MVSCLQRQSIMKNELEPLKVKTHTDREIEDDRAEEDVLELAEQELAEEGETADLELGTERDYLDDEHPESEDGDITTYRTEGEPLEPLTDDDPRKETATPGGKYAGGGKHR
jgi:hypothetical protein